MGDSSLSDQPPSTVNATSKTYIYTSHNNEHRQMHKSHVTKPPENMPELIAHYSHLNTNEDRSSMGVRSKNDLYWNAEENQIIKSSNQQFKGEFQDWIQNNQQPRIPLSSLPNIQWGFKSRLPF